MKILIAGLSKTGTTGLLYLIVNSMDKKPRILFEPSVCPSDVVSETKDVVAKVLIGGNLNIPSFAHFEKKITIIRDPRDRIVSSLLYSQYDANYLKNNARVDVVRKCLEKKETNPGEVSLTKILDTIGNATDLPNKSLRFQKSIAVLLDSFDNYIASTDYSLLYKYEDFVSGKYDAIAQYLDLNITGTAEVPDNLQRVNRTKGFGDWRNWFTDEDVQIYKPILSTWLKKYGFDSDDWKLNDHPTILPEHCSEYFMRLVNESRLKHNRKSVALKHYEKPANKKNLIGKIIKLDSDVIAGWAIGNNPSEPINVALLVNGKEIAQTLADKPRPGLKENGLHPTGACGFVFRFNPDERLKIGDEVKIMPLNCDFSITNSPCIIGQNKGNVS